MCDAIAVQFRSLRNWGKGRGPQFQLVSYKATILSAVFGFVAGVILCIECHA